MGATMDTSPRDPILEDVYAAKSGYRWLALVAALLAWGFDGVEQGVYTILTRPALRDLIPGLSDVAAGAVLAAVVGRIVVGKVAAGPAGRTAASSGAGEAGMPPRVS